MSAPAPKVSPPAARSAARPPSAPVTTPPITPDLPASAGFATSKFRDIRSSIAAPARPERPCSPMMRSVASRTASSNRLPSAFIARVSSGSPCVLSRPSEAIHRPVRWPRLAGTSTGSRSTIVTAICFASKRIDTSNTSRLRARHAWCSRAYDTRLASETSAVTAPSSVSSCTQQRANASSAMIPRTTECTDRCRRHVSSSPASSSRVRGAPV